VERVLPRDAGIRPRDLLGRFLFSGDDVDKPVSVLSGGERTRLALARLLVQRYNLLCLDEPTNHLDIPSRDALEEALDAYEGAIVLITHDRHLIRSVADRILEVEGGRVRSYEGDYELYLYRKEREAAPAPPDTAPPPRPRRDPKERRRLAARERERMRASRAAVRRVERDLENATRDLRDLEERLADPGVHMDPGHDVGAMARRHGELKERIADLESEWERVAEEAEGPRQ
jgi:ATP-binding cassette subfamily F protein 3